MPTPEQHAFLSASSASRWLHCTAAPHFEANFPESTSEYAEEGRLAHAVCELKVLRKFTSALDRRAFTDAMQALRQDPLYAQEMERTSDTYVEHLTELAMTYPAPPNVAAEVRVDFSDYVPSGFGTCDCVMVGGDTLSITDYKHGKGVPVSAVDNPQMRLYALGALKRYAPVYGGHIQKVCMTIDQPRISDTVSRETISVQALIAWGESIRPVAQQAYTGPGTFLPGEHCRFCRGKAQCKARADAYTALEDFKVCMPPQGALTDEQIGDLLTRGKELAAWYKDLEAYALRTLLNGGTIPGWKAVAGRSNRTFTDQDAAIAAVLAAGYEESMVFDRKPKSLSELEKLMGKADFADKLGAYVTKPVGKPTLAPASDAREAYHSANVEFAGITK